MSITQFKNTATLPLDESSPVAVPLGEPIAIASTTSVERDDGVETGVWECTPAAGAGRSLRRSSAISSPGAARSPRTAAAKPCTYKVATH